MNRSSALAGLAPPAGRVAAGFTLVELLVALAVIGLISTLMFGGFQFGLRAWESSSERTSKLAAVEAVRDFLRQELVQIGPLMLHLQGKEPGGVFAGQFDTLRFAAPLPAHRDIGGAHVFLLSVTGIGAEKQLLLQRQLYRPDVSPGDAPYGDPIVLLERVDEVALAYFGSERDSADPAWHDNWPRTDILPELIRLDIRFPDGDPRQWPEFTVAPKNVGSTLND